MIIVAKAIRTRLIAEVFSVFYAKYEKFVSIVLEMIAIELVVFFAVVCAEHHIIIYEID